MHAARQARRCYLGYAVVASEAGWQYLPCKSKCVLGGTLLVRGVGSALCCARRRAHAGGGQAQGRARRAAGREGGQAQAHGRRRAQARWRRRAGAAVHALRHPGARLFWRPPARASLLGPADPTNILSTACCFRAMSYTMPTVHAEPSRASRMHAQLMARDCTCCAPANKGVHGRGEGMLRW